MIRIVIADDHTIMREGLCRLLSDEHDMEVVGEASSGREAVDKCRELLPDAILLDLDMPDIDGFEAIRQIKAMGLATKILVLTMYGHEEYAVRTIQAGASGFAVKGISQKELPGAIRKVFEGGMYVAPTIMERTFMRLQNLGKQSSFSSLSEREHQIFIRLAKGVSMQDISDELCLSASSVRTYKKRIMDKLGFEKISDLTRYATQNNLISKF